MKTVIMSGNGNEQLYQYLPTDGVLVTAGTAGKEFNCRYWEQSSTAGTGNRVQLPVLGKSSTAGTGNRVLLPVLGTEFYCRYWEQSSTAGTRNRVQLPVLGTEFYCRY